jgi:hypothetical protein
MDLAVCAGKSGVGLVSRNAEPDKEDAATVVGKLHFKKKKSVHGSRGALQTANKENSASPADTRGLHEGVKRLDFRAQQLDKAQAQLRKAWNAPW